MLSLIDYAFHITFNIRLLIDSLIHRFAWCIKKIEESIRIDSARKENRYYHDSRLGKSILSWFVWLVNRYYHDSRLGKLILSWFEWVVNRYYHDSQISKKIDSNRSIKSMKIKKIDLNRFYQWCIDVNRLFCDLRWIIRTRR